MSAGRATTYGMQRFDFLLCGQDKLVHVYRQVGEVAGAAVQSSTVVASVGGGLSGSS
mgnify:CR=1 FL=1